MNRKFRVQITIRKHMNSWGSSWDLANALKTYKNISGQPYSRDDIFATQRPRENITSRIISTLRELLYLIYNNSFIHISMYFFISVYANNDSNNNIYVLFSPANRLQLPTIQQTCLFSIFALIKHRKNRTLKESLTQSHYCLLVNDTKNIL